MAIRKRTQDIPIAGGYGDKASEFLLQPPLVRKAKNAQFLKTGRVEKRVGQDLHSSGGGAGYTVHTLATLGDRLLALTDKNHPRRYTGSGWQSFYSSDGTADATHPVMPAQVEIDRIRYASVKQTGILQADVATDGTYEVIVWVDLTGAWGMARRLSDRSVAMPPTQIDHSAVSSPRDVLVAYDGSNFLYVVSKSSAVGWGYLDTTSDPWSWGETGSDSSINSKVVGLCVDENGTEDALLVYDDSSVMRVQAWDKDGVNASSTFMVDCSDRVACCWNPNSSLYTIVYAPGSSGGAGFEAMTLNTSLAQQDTIDLSESGGTTQSLSVVPDGSNVWVVVTDTGQTDEKHTYAYELDSSLGIPVTSTENLYHADAMGHPVIVNGLPVVPVVWQEPTSDVTQSLGMFVTPYNTSSNDDHWGVIGRFAVSRAARYPTVPATPHAYSSGDRHTWSIPLIGPNGTPLLPGGFGLVTLDLDPEPLRSVEHGGAVYFSGASPMMMDGDRFYELTPHFAPAIESISAAAGSSGLSAGSYSWVVVYEYEDAAGNIHRSAPSVAETLTTSASDDVTLSVPQLGLTAADGDTAREYLVVVYRTKVDAPGVYYLQSRNQYSHSSTKGLVDIVDDTADSSLGETLYTTGNVLEAQAPPGLRDITKAKNRFFGISSDDPSKIWYSKLLEDFVVPEFNGALTIRVPRGEAVALESQSDKLVIFATSGIWVVDGDGPTNTGVQDTFTQPRRVSDLACTERTSVRSFEGGIAFRSDRGIHILNRAFQAQFIGANVEDQISSSDAIASVVEVPSRSEIRLLLKDDSAVLVYNYLFGSWSTWSLSLSGCHAVEANGSWIWAENGANFATYTDGSSSTRTDESSGIQYDFELDTAWLRLSGIQDYQRIRKVRLLGELFAAEDVQVKVLYNYSSDSDTITFDSADIASLDPLQIAIAIPRQKVESIQLQITGTNGNDNGSGFAIDGLQLEYGVYGGGYRLPKANRL